MSSTKKLTTQEFCKRIHLKYPNLDLSMVNYINSQTKVHLRCPQHGDIFVTPNQILMSKSQLFCQQCEVESGNKRALRYKSTEAFLTRYKTLYPDQYLYFDFSKTIYAGVRNPIIVTCPVHGDITTTPFSMLLPKALNGTDGHICWLCNEQKKLNDYFNEIKQKTIMLFPDIEIRTTSLIYNDKTVGNREQTIELFCKKHKRSFSISLDGLRKHVQKKKTPCHDCIGKNKFRNYSTEEFIEYLKKKYPDKQYDYSKTEYIDWKTKVKIICPYHGEFWRLPQRLDEGRGCPYCKESLLERNMRLFLLDEKINFIYQYRNKNILGKRSIDFFLPDYNAAIECQGKQHLNCNSMYNKNHLTIMDIYANDQKKMEMCINAGIRLFYFTNVIPDISYFDKLWYNKKEMLEAIKNGK